MSSFDWDKDYTIEELLQSVIAIKELPNKLAKLLNVIKEGDVEKTYRDGSWNIRQIIHHLADSSMNGYLRTQHCIHADVAEIQLYDQDAWANGKGKEFHHEASFMILLGLHQRWSLLLLECLKEPEKYLAKSIYYPLQKKQISLSQLIAFYAWHGDYHLEQIHQALNN